MGSYFDKSAFALEYAAEVIPIMKDIVEPLTINTPITNFSYLKFQEDGSVVNLSTDIKLIDYRFENNIKYRIMFESQLDKKSLGKPYLYLWPSNPEDELLGALQSFNIWNGCNVYIPYKDNIEVFSFTSTTEFHELHNFYVDNFDTLTQFILYFKAHLYELLLDASQKAKIKANLVFPSHLMGKDSGRIFNSKEIFKCNGKKTNIIQGVDLTYREMQCCYFIGNGMSMKSVAEELCLSKRTIESHIENIKQKANCLSKETLIGFINKHRWVFESIFSEENL